MDSLRVSVVGAGPVGSIIAAHLIEAGAEVVMCDISPKRIDALRRDGIILTNTIEKTVPVRESVNSIRDLAAYDLDLVVYALKCPFLLPALEETQGIDNGKFYLMSAQNGIGTELDIASTFSRERTLRMVINFAGNLTRTSSGEDAVNVTFFNPPNYVSALSEEGEEMEERFVQRLNSVGLTTESSDNLQIHVWQKAILNATLSPLCAITGQTMEDVMSFGPAVRLAEGVIRESIKVAEADGLDLGSSFLESAMGYLKKGGKHKPTMLVDIENRLPTEIDYLNGKIEKYGRKHDIPVPLNSTLGTIVKLLESKYSD
ncbi:MAG: ketopantoate reductase C-terminal domain-containing protein [Candidatus Neomarinimicrobiota bacterium]